MRDLVFLFYSLALRMFGLLSLIMFAGVVSVLATGIVTGPSVVAYSSVGAIFLVFGLRMSLPNLTPAWLRDPRGPLLGLSILVVSVPFLLGYMFLLIEMVKPFQGKAIFGIGIMVWHQLLLYLVVGVIGYWGVLGFFNCFYNGFFQKRPVKPTSQSGDASTLIHPTTNAELRSLRQSRMSR